MTNHIQRNIDDAATRLRPVWKPSRAPGRLALRLALVSTVCLGAPVMAQLLPNRVDLTAQQSPVKDQGARDTCGSFTTVAAVEALYRRNHKVILDLSEQYLNHWAQQLGSAQLGTQPVPLNETPAGSIGGGGIGRPLSALARGLALPPETSLPYIPDRGYQSVDVGDLPSLNDWSISYPQRAIDDFNLADAPAWYTHSPPQRVWTTVMPQAALDAARYRPTGVTELTGAEVNSVDKYRAVLASGREVMMEFRCCDGNPGLFDPQPWMLPPGSDGGPAAHAVLVVGYDDSRQLFRVKNSWGTAWADNGYAWVSYERVRRAAYRAAYLKDVESTRTRADPFNFHHYVLGRWQLAFDGWKGVLDIYNLPGPYVFGRALNYRLGTLFMPDGRIHRVNGYASGNALRFFVDWTQPDLPPSVLSGVEFTTWVFTHDHKAMAGVLVDPSWGTFPAAAVKGTAPISGHAHPGGLSLSSYLGTWDFNHDGWRGRLEITGVDPAMRSLSGQYVDAQGKIFTLSGVIHADTRLFELSIGFNPPQSFQGSLSGHELGVMGGSTTRAGLTFGFYGTRRP